VSSCPSCKTRVETPLKGWTPRCASCGIPLRSPLTAVALSIALPGLGHWYLERRALAVIEMALGFALFTGSIVHLVIVFIAVLNETRPLWDIMRVALWWAPAIIGYGILDALFTWLVSRRRVLLKEPVPPPS